MTLFCNLFNILRIEIATTNDDQILKTACDIEIPCETKTEIPSAQKWPRSTLTLQTGLKRLSGLLRLLPIASCNVRTPQPDFSNGTGYTGDERLRIDNGHLLALAYNPTTHKASTALLIYAGRHRLSSFKLRSIKGLYLWQLFPTTT